MSAEITRRVALGRIIKATLATEALVFLPALSSCQWQPESQTLIGKERENSPQPGDVVTVGKDAFLLRSNGKRYPFHEGELDKYVKASKLTEYGRRILPVSQGWAEEYPVGQGSDDAFFVSKSTGLPVVNKMGEAIVPWMGMLSSEKIELPIKPASFPEITEALSLQGWTDFQSILFTYGNKPRDKSIDEAIREGGFGYNALDTLRSLKDLFADASAHFNFVQELLPYCQINPVAHSLGGLLVMQAVMEHPSSVNSLVLISSPVRGLRKDFFRGQLYDFVRNNASKYDIEESFINGILALVGDLFALWDNKEYQRKLDEFTTSFVASGKKLINIVVENDIVVPEESSKLKGATEIRIKNQSSSDILGLLRRLFGPQQELIDYAITVWNAHGLGLSDQESIQAIKQAFGNNFSFLIGTVKPNIPRFPIQPDFK